MTLIRKIVFLFILFIGIIIFLTPKIFAENDENYIVLNDHEMNFKLSNMINIEFIEFNDLENLIQKDIVYKKTKNHNLKLDLLLPEIKLRKSYPVVLYIHGGGFIRGDKDEIYSLKPLIDEWLENGWAVISINYRLLYGDNIFPDNYNDVIDAIDWIGKNKGKYNFDTERLCVIGHSAGGNLALLSGLKNKNINCIVSMAGPTKLYGENTFQLRKKMMSVINKSDFNEKMLKKASPINFLTPESPPVLLLHGTIDNFVPYNQSKLFYEKAKMLEAKCKFITIKGGGHILELSYLPRMPKLKERIIDFMEENIE